MDPKPHHQVPSEMDAAFTRRSDRGHAIEPSFAGALSFMRRRYAKDLDGVDLAVMGIPLDLTVTNRPGTRLGPRAIRAASAQLAWAGPWPWEFDPYDELAVVDHGDCFFDPGRPEEIPAAIEAAARAVIDRGCGLLSLGGDHFVTYPLLKAHAAVHGPLALVQFDAHSDTWADEPGRVDHGTMLFHAVRDGLIDPARSVQIGLRTHNTDPLGFNVIDGRALQRLGPAAVAERVRELVGVGPAYVTLDIDVLDASAAPGTGTPVIGGPQSWQVQEILVNLVGLDVVGMDVVEVSPPFDVSEITALAAATFANDLVCLYARAKAARDRRGGASA